MKKMLISILTIASILLLSGCANAGKDQIVNEGDTVTLDGSNSQAKYGWTILKYKWKQIQGKHVQLENKNTKIATFIAPDIGKKKQRNLVFALTTIEKSPWNTIRRFKDRVKIKVKLYGSEDIVPPVITLNGDSNITLYVGDTYVEEGAIAKDNIDGNVSVEIKGNVDTSKEGNYTVAYEASDKAGNKASKIRKIEVKELSDTEKIQELEDNGTIPKLNRDNTLTGEDNNSNGIRDDIDRYIDEHYMDPKKHAAVVQEAKALQKILLVDKTNIDKVKEVSREVARAIECIFNRFELTKVPFDNISAITFNTKIRLLEDLKFSQALDGTVSSGLEGDTCE